MAPKKKPKITQSPKKGVSSTAMKNNGAVLKSRKNKVTTVEPESPDPEPIKPSCPVPCREAQFNDILAFLESNIELKSSGCMYVSGVPGTGKTLIVKSVLEVLQNATVNNKEGNKSTFKNIYINGLTLSAPNRIWKRFYNDLNPSQQQRLTPDAAYKKLQLYFEKQHDPIILIIDELDQILDKQQAILYRLLDWTVHPTNLFSLICIFNTMHLPESILTMRNASRMGMARCAFPPYTHEELATIVRRAIGSDKSSRLNEALLLLSRKVAAISGDARRALEIAKRTLEIVEEKDEEGTSASAINAVSEAFKELFCSPKIEAVKHCSALEKLILRSILAELQSSGSDETQVLKVVNSVNSSAPFEETEMVTTTDQIIRSLRKLYESRIILMESNRSSLYNKISLNVSIPDIQYGLLAVKQERY